MIPGKHLLACAALLAWHLPCTAAAAVAGYPERPVRLIVPFAPGGGADIVARFVGQRLTEAWGQQVVIDNRGGASAMIGTEAAARAAPDGYTLFLGTNQLAINPALYKKLLYDPVRDFAPVTQLATAPLILVVHPGLAAHSVTQLIALARTRPGALNMASSGNAGPPHLAGELFQSMAGIRMLHVPYKGSGQAIPALVGGQVDVMFATLPSALPQVKAGRLRGLAVTALKPGTVAPGLPVVADTLPGFESTAWYGLVLPAQAPARLIARIHDDVGRIIAGADFRARMAAEGAEPAGSTPAQFAEFIRTETMKWARVVRISGARADR